MNLNTAQEAIGARRQAVEDIERLLQFPEDLKHLTTLREDYAAKQQANKAQLSAAVASQMEATKSGLDALNRAHQALLKLREDFALITALCAECQSLIDCHDKIQLLSAVHGNLRKTLQDVENIAALPAEAAEAEEMLKNDANLLQVYETLALLEGTSQKAQHALESGTHVDLREAKNLNSYFQKVKQAQGKFEERLWSIVRNFLGVSRSDPDLLVTALQVVELQEMVDAQLLAAGQGASALRKGWRRRCLHQISNCVQDIFAPLLQQCSQLIAAGENTDQRVSEILAHADSFVLQLPDIYDFVVPCFPPDYHIFSAICTEYHRQLDSMVDFIGLCADNLANSDILKVVEWMAGYQETLTGLGMEDEDIRFPAGPRSGMGLLVDKYNQRTVEMLTGWLNNIVEADFRYDPKVSDDGRVWTPGAVEFFRILNEQIAVVAAVNRDTMLLRVAQSACQIMLSFQSAQRRHLGEGLALEQLCAVVNNNVRCYDESLDFMHQLEKDLAPHLKGQLDIEAACRGFLELAKEAVHHCVSLVYADPGFVELFGRLYCSEEWRCGVTTSSITATLEDFLQDYSRMLEQGFYRRVAEGCLHDCVAHFMAALLTQLKTVLDDDIAAIRRDEAKIREFFGGFVKPEKVSRDCQPITDLCEFLAGDSVESFVLSYTTLLTSSPGVSPTLLSGLVNARVATDKNMTKADAREILENCREVFAERQQRGLAEDALASATPAPQPTPAGAKTRGLTAKETAFRAALKATRKLPADRVGRGGGDSVGPSPIKLQLDATKLELQLEGPGES